MNTKQAAIVSFLSRAARGETEMSPHIINEFAENCKQALNKQFNECNLADKKLEAEGCKKLFKTE